MQTNPPILLVDTNIWLDVYLPHRPQRDAALDLIKEARNKGASLTFPSQAVLDVYQRVSADNKRWVRESRQLTEEYALAIKRLAWDCIVEMQRIATPIPVDKGDLYLACVFRDTHDDLEDDLVMAACQRAYANYLVTNDRKLLAHSPIDARTPQQMVELLKSGLAAGTPVERNTKDDLSWLSRWLGVEQD